jgi:hypothetical protein
MAPLLNLGYDRAGKWGFKRGRRDKKGTKRKKEKGLEEEEEGRRGEEILPLNNIIKVYTSSLMC